MVILTIWAILTLTFMRARMHPVELKVTTQKVEHALGRWSPGDLVVIKGLELVNEQGSSDSILVITSLFQAKSNSWPNFKEDMFEVVITFTDVNGLCLDGLGGGGVQVMGFDIRFVGDRGLEGINFEIEDYEDRRIRFNCRSIHIQSVSNTSHI